FFFQAEDGIRDRNVTGVQTCALPISKKYIFQILKIGIPSGFEQVMYQSCQLIFLFYITYLGAENLAARQYANNISMFTYLFAIEVGMETSIILGCLFGGNKKEESYRRVWYSVRWSLSITSVMVILVIIFRRPIIQIFTNDSTVIDIATTVLLFGLLLETGRSINIVLVNSLRASGDAKYPLFIGMFSMVMMSVPLGYFLVFTLDLGLVGVWLAIAADEWLRACIFFLRWRSRKWERHALVEPEAETN